ncbi:HAMP domain-containing sensor histidine kinase [Massilia sp. Leaf139]|uniref:sensor histidine kinase n=1 Tax=Massilia sp. Leaf139 TaxID=1736272 RepID=UPI0006F51A87|nr:HAMP domain-containing sensor histidine kinase [Massilia sp. Leaf139]KQQ97318.1 hypothetical protein ASF77_05030 [Massilia sp. Leaf139]
MSAATRPPLGDSDAWLTALLAQLPEGVLLLDGDLRIVAANPAAGLLFGREPGQLAGRGVGTLFVEAVGAALSGQGADAPLSLQLTGRGADGATRPMHANARLHGAHGARRTVLTVRDSAPDAEQAWRVRAAGERRHKTFTQAAHELRTPLASILGFSELLIKREFAPGEARELLEIIHAQGQRMATVMNQVFDLARIEAGGRAALRLAATPLDGVLVQALAAVKLPDAQARVQIDLAPGLPPLAADPHRLALALANALDNALRYSAPETPVRVHASAAPDGSLVLLEVADAGAGMTPEQRERLFEPFHRGPQAQEDGTGLGMAIFKEIMDVHGAAVAVRSAPDAGTTLTIRLPAAQAESGDRHG